MRARWGLVVVALALAVPAAADVRMTPRALLDVGWVSHETGRLYNRHSQGDSQFDPYRMRLFLDAQVTPQLAVFAQSILHEGAMPIVLDGAYARWTPWAERDLHVQAGKIPWPIGTWGPRTYSDRNRLIGSPLMYQYHTSLPWNAVPWSVDELVSEAGHGQTGLFYGGEHSYGMVVVDDRWWDFGIAALGSTHGLEFSLGATQSSPGWPEPNADDTPGNGYLGRIGLAPVPALRVGVSGAYGPWMPTWSEWAVPPGGSLRDYAESMVMLDASLSLDRLDLQGEGYDKSWETLRTGTLRMRGGYLETSVMMPAGWWLAARAEAMRFGEVTPSNGIPRPWDDDVDRLEIGAGYRLSQDVRAKVAWQRNRLRPPGQEFQDEDMVALALSIKLH